jgi:hypothetical protein
MQLTPLYPDFKPLSLADREQTTSLLHHSPPVTSELTFTNIFMWRHRYNLQWCVGENSLLIIGEGHSGQPFALPPVGPDDLTVPLRQLLDYLGELTSTPEIHRVPEALAQRYAEPLSLEIEQDRANSDYVYRTESLIKLRGRKYHRKRNQLKQFRARYSYRYEPLNHGFIQDCLELEEQWCHIRNCSENPALFSEEQAIREVLLHYHKLDCHGAVILVDGKVVAFSLGEPLNPDTAVIHVEKANPEYPGSYAVINQEFCHHAWRDFTFINREQDLGEPGLRQAKLSYYPDHMSNKVTLRLRDH